MPDPWETTPIPAAKTRTGKRSSSEAPTQLSERAPQTKGTGEDRRNLNSYIKNGLGGHKQGDVPRRKCRPPPVGRSVSVTRTGARGRVKKTIQKTSATSEIRGNELGRERSCAASRRGGKSLCTSTSETTVLLVFRVVPVQTASGQHHVRCAHGDDI